MTTESAPGLAGWPPPVLDPAGPFAGPVEVVAWVLFVMAAVVLTVVLIALGVALFGPRKWKRRVGGERLVWIGGLAFPVVVLTTFNLDDRAATAIRHGASGFLLKDTTPVQLRDAIRTVHAGNAVLAPQDLATLLDGQLRAQAPPPATYLSLTDKEREVFTAVARGHSNGEIAQDVFVSESTVKTHVGAILRKLGLRDRVQIVVFAHEHGLVD